jgi:hypothetical protein
MFMCGADWLDFFGAVYILNSTGITAKHSKYIDLHGSISVLLYKQITSN